MFLPEIRHSTCQLLFVVTLTDSGRVDCLVRLSWRVHCCFSRSNSASARANSSLNSTTFRSCEAINFRNVEFASSSREGLSSTDDLDEVGTGERLARSLPDPSEPCFDAMSSGGDTTGLA